MIANETVAGRSLIEVLESRKDPDLLVTVIAPVNQPREGYVVYEDTRRAAAGLSRRRTGVAPPHAGYPRVFHEREVRMATEEKKNSDHGVVGRLDQSTPQVALRAGAYGYFLPIPWDAVFDGDSDSIQDVLDASDLGLAQEGFLEPGA